MYLSFEDEPAVIPQLPSGLGLKLDNAIAEPHDATVITAIIDGYNIAKPRSTQPAHSWSIR